MGSFENQLPKDPDESLRIGLRVIESAYDSKTRHLEGELSHARQYGKERQAQVLQLERRVAELEQQCRDSDEKARKFAAENAQLSHDLKAAQRDVSKLDSFKRSILQSVKDDEPAMRMGSYSAEPAFTPGGPGAARESLLTALPAGPKAYSPSHSTPGPLGGGGYSGAASPPGRAATPADPPGSSSVVDGKDFFRQARLRLTYEQFNQFLSNIKRLNDHAQSRDETLAKAQQIFGEENGDLFSSFKQLLSKHGLTV